MIQIVYMTASHVSGVAGLEKICFSDPWNEAAVASELENPLSLWLVAIAEDRVIGYVGSQSVMGEADMMNLAVAPEFRRRGVAENLVNSLIRELDEKGVYSLTLEVLPQDIYYTIDFTIHVFHCDHFPIRLLFRRAVFILTQELLVFRPIPQSDHGRSFRQQHTNSSSQTP